jgi:hypothetical protein
MKDSDIKIETDLETSKIAVRVASKVVKTEVLNTKPPFTLRSRRANVTHPRWPMWCGAVKSAIESGNTKTKRAYNFWTKGGTHSKEAGYQGVLNDVGATLNHITEETKDYAASLNIVGQKYGIPAATLKTVYFEKGALAQTILNFEMLKTKSGHAETLVLLVKTLRSSGTEFEQAKSIINGRLLKMKTKNPQDKRTIQDIVLSSRSYDELVSGLLNAQLSFEGLGVLDPSKERLVAGIEMKIPLKRESQIRKAQILKKLGRAKITSSKLGMTVVASLNDLETIGIATRIKAKVPSKIASKPSILAHKFWNIGDGLIAGKIFTSDSSNAINIYGESFLSSIGVHTAEIVDASGKRNIFQNGKRVSEIPQPVRFKIRN